MVSFLKNHTCAVYCFRDSNKYRKQYDCQYNLVFISTSKFFKHNKITCLELMGQVQFVVSEKLTSFYLHQLIVQEIMMLVVNNFHDKRIRESRDTSNFGTTHCLLFTLVLQLCTCVTILPSCYMKNSPIFSQSDMYNFSCI